MQLCMCCHGRCVFQTVCIFFLALASAAISGLVGKAYSPPICLHSPLVQLGLDLGFFVLKGTKSDTLDIRSHWLLSRVQSGNLEGWRTSENSLSWGSPLLSWGVYLWLFNIWRFWRELQNGLRKFRVIPAQPDLEDPYRFSQRSPSLWRVAFSIWPLLDGGILVGSSCLYGSLLIKELQSVLEELLCDCEWCPWELLPYLLVPLSLNKESSSGAIFPYLRQALFFVAVSPLILYRNRG